MNMRFPHETITMAISLFVGLLMLQLSLSKKMLRWRLPSRCPSCGRLRRADGRCPNCT